MRGFPPLVLLLFCSGCLQGADQSVIPTVNTTGTAGLEIHEIPIKVVVGGHVGVDVTKEFLSFGMIPPGGSGKRWVNFANIVNVSRVVHLEVTGDVSDWVYFPENDFLLKRGQAKRLEISIRIPKDAAYGNYTGAMIMQIK